MHNIFRLDKRRTLGGKVVMGGYSGRGDGAYRLDRRDGAGMHGIFRHGCQMALAGFLESYVFGPLGFWTMDPLRYAAKLDPFLSLDCAGVEGGGANFAI